MNNDEYHFEGVRAWQAANKNLKIFSECCYRVKNKQALAADCKCSPRTVEFYAAAWSLYQELLLEYENETVSRLWEQGEISLWRKAPQLRNALHLTLDKTYEYLKIAIEGDMNRDTFAAHVDGKENQTPQWIRRLQSAIRTLLPKDGGRDWMTDMPVPARERYEKLMEYVVSELEAIANVPEPPMVTEFQMLTGETEGEQG